MQARGMMAVNNKRPSFSNDLCGRRLRSFVEASFSGIAFELLRRFVGSPTLEGLRWRSGLLFLRMDRSGVSINSFPRVSALHDPLRNSQKIECLWSFD